MFLGLDSMGKTKFCQGISDISDSYMGFIIDLWGVLHDGKKAYEQAVDTLKELRGRNKQIILLSNTPYRAMEVKEQLKKMGIGPSLYDQILTTSEMICTELKEKEGRFFEDLGNRCFLMNKTQDISIFENTDIKIVDDIKDASFLLIAGADPRFRSVSEWEKILKEGVRRHIKAICANPDSKALIGTNFLMGPALFSKRYQDFGGVVHYVGKPHLPIFQKCVQWMQGKEIYPGEIVMIGDTMAHDIIGAHNANIDTCLVKKGIHNAHFSQAETPADTDKILNVLTAQYNNVRPTYLVDQFEWGKALPDRKHKKRKLLKKKA